MRGTAKCTDIFGYPSGTHAVPGWAPVLTFVDEVGVAA
jgi:hypothetical protein